MDAMMMEYCNNVIKDNILFVTKQSLCEGVSTDFLRKGWGYVSSYLHCISLVLITMIFL